jgi:putative ABC transport system permease protein
MIGLTLVVSMGVFASSLKASFSDVISDRTNADLFVTASSAQAPGFSPSVVDAVRSVPGVDEISPNGWGQARFASEAKSYSAVDPATAEGIMNLDVSQGSLADLGEDGVVVSTSAARSHGWELGDTVPAEFAETGKQRLQVVGTYDGKGWISDDYIISLAAQNTFAGPQLVTAGLVTVADGADPGEVQAAVDDALATHPDARVLDQDGYEEVASGFIDQLLTFVTVMLLLAVVIALLGHRQHAGAVGVRAHPGAGPAAGRRHDPHQVRAMVRWESAVISLIGAVSGAVLGIGIGWRCRRR